MEQPEEGEQEKEPEEPEEEQSPEESHWSYLKRGTRRRSQKRSRTQRRAIGATLARG